MSSSDDEHTRDAAAAGAPDVSSDEQEEEEDYISHEEAEELKEALAEHIDEELRLKGELAKIKKLTNPPRKRIKQYMAQEDLEEFRVTGTYSIVAKRKPAFVINKTALLNSKIVTGKKRKQFLQECTVEKTTFSENVA